MEIFPVNREKMVFLEKDNERDNAQIDPLQLFQLSFKGRKSAKGRDRAESKESDELQIYHPYVFFSVST